MVYLRAASRLAFIFRASWPYRNFSKTVSLNAPRSGLLMTISEEAGINGKDTPSLVKSLQSNGFISSTDVAAAFLRLDRAVFAADPAAPPSPAPYSNTPLRLAFSETMTSPAMHARCVQALYSTGMLVRGAVCADVGTGSGFVAAALAILAGSTGKVVAVERIECVRKNAACPFSTHNTIQVSR
jgi:protein-L-isoaspartate O-methyltransferase